MVICPVVHHSFVLTITTAGETTSRYLFQRYKLCEKIIIYENNYSCENN